MKNKYILLSALSGFSIGFGISTLCFSKKDKKSTEINEGYVLEPIEDDVFTEEHIDEEVYDRLQTTQKEEIMNMAIEATKKRIFKIKEEEFLHEEKYDKETLTYYIIDGVLCRTDDSIVESVDGVVDLEILTFFENIDEDSETGIYTVYVRNENLEMDYEIIGVEQSYSEAVLGEVHGYTVDDGDLDVVIKRGRENDK